MWFLESWNENSTQVWNRLWVSVGNEGNSFSSYNVFTSLICIMFIHTDLAISIMCICEILCPQSVGWVSPPSQDIPRDKDDRKSTSTSFKSYTLRNVWWIMYSGTSPCGHPAYVDTMLLWTLFLGPIHGVHSITVSANIFGKYRTVSNTVIHLTHW